MHFYAEIMHSDWLKIVMLLGISNQSALVHHSYDLIKFVYDRLLDDLVLPSTYSTRWCQ